MFSRGFLKKSLFLTIRYKLSVKFRNFATFLKNKNRSICIQNRSNFNFLHTDTKKIDVSGLARA